MVTSAGLLMILNGNRSLRLLLRDFRKARDERAWSKTSLARDLIFARDAGSFARDPN